MAFNIALPSSTTGIPSPAEIQGFIEAWTPPQNDGDPLDKLLPMVNNLTGNIVAWDTVPAIEGLLPAYVPGSLPKVKGIDGMQSFVEMPLYWGGTYQVLGHDMINTRKPGSANQMAGRDLCMRQVRTSQYHIDARLKQQKWATIQNTNIVDDNGVKRTINYSGIQTASASTAWSTIATANMRSDVMAFLAKFDNKGAGKVRGYISKKTARIMAQNAAILAWAVASPNVNPEEVTEDTIGKFLCRIVGGLASIEVYDGGYFSGGTYYNYIPEGKLVLIADPPQGYPLGEFRTTPAIQNNGNCGRWSVIEDKLQTKYACWDITAGIHGIPILYFPQLIVVCTVYTP